MKFSLMTAKLDATISSAKTAARRVSHHTSLSNGPTTTAPSRILTQRFALDQYRPCNKSKGSLSPMGLQILLFSPPFSLPFFFPGKKEMGNVNANIINKSAVSIHWLQRLGLIIFRNVFLKKIYIIQSPVQNYALSNIFGSNDVFSSFYRMSRWSYG